MYRVFRTQYTGWAARERISALEVFWVTTEPFVVTRQPMGLRPPDRKNLLWGVGGLVVGALAMLLLLLLLAPQPKAAVPARPGTSDITITLDDAALTQVLQSSIKATQSPLTITNLAAQIMPGDKVVISGDAVLLPGTPSRQFTTDADLYTTNGHLALHLANSRFGGTPAPAFLTGLIEDQINAELAKPASAPGLAGEQYLVSGVSTQANHMVITLITP